jgi:hypothetical protein
VLRPQRPRIGIKNASNVNTFTADAFGASFAFIPFLEVKGMFARSRRTQKIDDHWMPRALVLVALGVWISTSGCGQPDVADERPSNRLLSASRPAGESFGDSLKKNLPEYIGKEDSGSQTVINRRLQLAQVDFSQAVEWSDAQLNEGFLLARDTRFISLDYPSDFPRRPSFLYPDDGCFVRAEAMGYLLESRDFPRPSKVFIFGNLRVTTSNSPEGVVSWWYHVALLVKSKGTYWVIDPAIEPQHPLTLEEWMGWQTTLEDALFSVCNPYAYWPDGECFPVRSADPRETAMGSQSTYLNAEWERQLELGRDPNKVLGDQPPWIRK